MVDEKTREVTITFDEFEHESLVMFSEREKCSIPDFVRRLVREHDRAMMTAALNEMGAGDGGEGEG